MIYYTFLDDEDENGNIVIWSVFWMEIFQSENAELLSGAYEEDLTKMMDYSNPDSLPNDLMGILKHA